VNKKVIILGGGVAGLSAAHELMERGFKVAVYEKGSVPGGKARSFPVPDSGTEGRMGWPAEHGFRFFPRYYRNLPDTMKRIPYAKNPRGVYDNLIQLPRLLLAPDGLGMEPTVTLARFPRSLADLVVLLTKEKRSPQSYRKKRLGCSRSACGRSSQAAKTDGVQSYRRSTGGTFWMPTTKVMRIKNCWFADCPKRWWQRSPSWPMPTSWET